MLCVFLKVVVIIQMQIAIIEGNYEQERKSMKLRVSELEKKLEEATQKLVAAQSMISAKDTELSALHNNLRELEELREMKEVKSLRHNISF